MDINTNTANSKRTKAKASDVITEVSEELACTKQKVDIGFDISTSVIGICVLQSATGNMLHLSHIELSSTKFADIYEKVSESRKVIRKLFSSHSWTLNEISVEEFAKQFSPGFSSADTLFTLAKFNHAICQFIYDEYGIKPNKVNVRTMRKTVGININYKDKSKTTKQKVLDMVMNINPSFPWLTHLAKSGKFKGTIVNDKENEDMADSWVVAKGNWITVNGTSINTITVKKAKKK